MPWEPLPDSTTEPTRVDVSLDAVMAKLAGTSVGATEVVFDRWADIVGAGLAQYSRPSRIADRCLHVSATDAAFGSELRFMERTIVERVAELAGSCPFDRVRVTVTAP